MRHFKKKNLKYFSPERPGENVSPGPAVALDRRLPILEPNRKWIRCSVAETYPSKDAELWTPHARRCTQTQRAKLRPC